MILEEDFERYTNSTALHAVWPQGEGVLELRSPGGGHAVKHDGGEANRRGGFSILPSLAYNVVLTADLFDFGTNANKRTTVSLHNRRGAYLEMGAVGIGQTYAVRTHGFERSTEKWTAFGNAQPPVRGWHRFQAIISLSNMVATLDLDANGKVDWTVTLAGPLQVEPLTEVRFGGLANRDSPVGPMLIDNVRLELVPAPPVLVAETGAATGSTSPIPSVGTATSEVGVAQPSVAAVNATGSDVAVWWIMGALALIIALLARLVAALRRNGLRASMALVPASGNSSPPTPHAALAELTEFAKRSLVQGLYEQRNALLETQKQAQHALVELEQRLAALHLPQQERIRAYERRIAELEKELDTRGEEVRELTQATLLLVRRRLQEEKGLGRSRDQFN